MFRNTNEANPVGNLSEYLATQGSSHKEEKKKIEKEDLSFEEIREEEEKKKEPKIKVNHYKTMGLMKTSLVKRIV